MGDSWLYKGNTITASSDTGKERLSANRHYKIKPLSNRRSSMITGTPKTQP